MAISILNQLYPPQFSSTFAPAFPVTSTPRIYFSLSSYNSSNDIQRVHIIITNQKSNENVIKTGVGLLFKPLSYDTDASMYYVDISPSEIAGDEWIHNQYYKLQLRFDNADAPLNGVFDNAYLTENLEHFSEWSQVLLLRPISEPQVLIRPFDLESNQNKVLYFNKGVLHISGQMSFAADDEKETMSSYKADIVSAEDDNVMLLEGKTVYTSTLTNPNVIDALLDLSGLDTKTIQTFAIRLTTSTKSGYEMTKNYRFKIAEFIADDSFKPDVAVDMNDETGIATVSVKNEQSVFGSLYIKRSSSLSDFKDWEMIYSAKVAGPLDITISDNTVGSGVWYRYSAQLENSAGGLTQVFRSPIIFPQFFDAFLSREDRQMDLQFNYKISSVNPVVNRTKVDTLGGRYPKFVENAVMHYKQFSISGLISTQEDEFGLFFNKEDFFGNRYEDYQTWEKENFRDSFVTENYNDFWERGFREELVEWLNDGEPKLYRSMTEGLVVVMLTDVSLTPNAALSRRLYDFSATMYEIADGTSLENLDTLGIYPRTLIDTSVTGGSGQGPDPTPEFITVSKPGQLYQLDLGAYEDKVNVVSECVWANLQTRYGSNGVSISSSNILSSKSPQDPYLTNVKIRFNSKPHLFKVDTNGYGNIIQIPDDEPANATDAEKKNYMLGYCFEINNNTGDNSRVFFVGPQGYYQIPSNVTVTSLHFPQKDNVTLEYVVTYKEANSSGSHISSTQVNRTVVGQTRGSFAADFYLGESIRNKYTYTQPNKSFQKMQWWKGICVDVTPFAIVNIKYQDENTYNEYLVGETGVLHFLEDSKVQDLYFSGRAMEKVNWSQVRYCRDWQYAESGQTFASLKDIVKPQVHGVYTVAGFKYIYYIDEEFYRLVERDDMTIAKVPITGDINYYGDVMQIEIA